MGSSNVNDSHLYTCNIIFLRQFCLTYCSNFMAKLEKYMDNCKALLMSCDDDVLRDNVKTRDEVEKAAIEVKKKKEECNRTYCNLNNIS